MSRLHVSCNAGMGPSDAWVPAHLLEGRQTLVKYAQLLVKAGHQITIDTSARESNRATEQRLARDYVPGSTPLLIGVPTHSDLRAYWDQAKVL